MLAIASMFFAPPNIEYFGYIDFSVLGILFCLMTVIAGLGKVGVFNILSEKLLKRSKNIKVISILLVTACFLTAMLVTNDVALITFVPLTIGIIGIMGQRRLIFTIVMETIAANVGSMLTPIGNPQNLYIYSYYKLSIADFIKMVLPVCAVGFIVIMVIMLFSKSGQIDITVTKKSGIVSAKKLIVYIVLFILAILTVVHILDYRVCLIVTILSLIIVDREIFRCVDYSLLFTFVAFFIFVGNLEHIPLIKNAVLSLISGREFIGGVLASQVISNVPAAIMLAEFTDKVKPLLLGVNVGGLGTLIASLASLISFRFYIKSEGAKPLKFLGIFTALNVFVGLIMIASVYILK